MLYSATTNGFYTTELHGENMPSDVIEISGAKHAELMQLQSEGKVILADDDGSPITIEPPAPTVDQQVAAFTAFIQGILDDFAKTRNYDNALSCASYANSTFEKFATEAQYMIMRRDQIWSTAYAILADVEAGSRAIPTEEDLITELGPLEWPK